MLCKNDIKLKTLKNVRRILLETFKKIYKKNDELFILLLFKKHPCVTYFFEKNRLFEWTNKM